jgi:NAD(P)-dependent dehydrogenase (short-subunit alcohol dehydrogenase family)
MTAAVVIGASGAIGRALSNAVAGCGSYTSVSAFARLEVAASPPLKPGQIDLTDERSIASAAAVVAIEGPVGLVICASGILHAAEFSPEKTIATVGPEVMSTVLAINAIGPALVAFTALMPGRGRAVFAALSARVGSIEDNRLEAGTLKGPPRPP